MSRFRNVEQEMAQLANEDSTMGDTTSQQSDAEWGAAAAALHEDDDDEEFNEKVQWVTLCWHHGDNGVASNKGMLCKLGQSRLRRNNAYYYV